MLSSNPSREMTVEDRRDRSPFDFLLAYCFGAWNIYCRCSTACAAVENLGRLGAGYRAPSKNVSSGAIRYVMAAAVENRPQNSEEIADHFTSHSLARLDSCTGLVASSESSPSSPCCEIELIKETCAPRATHIVMDLLTDDLLLQVWFGSALPSYCCISYLRLRVQRAVITI